MNQFQRQVQALTTDNDLLGCSWFNKTQAEPQFFLKKNHYDYTVRKKQLTNSINCKQNKNHKNNVNHGKISLKREKEKITIPIPEIIVSSLKKQVHQQVRFNCQQKPDYTAINYQQGYMYNIPSQPQFNFYPSNSSYNSLQILPILKTTRSKSPVIAKQTNQIQTPLSPQIIVHQPSLKSNKKRPSIKTKAFPVKSCSNIDQLTQKSFISSTQRFIDDPEQDRCRNEDSYFYQSLDSKLTPSRVNENKSHLSQQHLSHMHEDGSKSWFMGRQTENSHIISQTFRSDLSESSISEQNGLMRRLKRMEDVQQIKSVLDQNDNFEDDKQSVVLGRLHQYNINASLVKSQNDNHHLRCVSSRFNRGPIQISTIVKHHEHEHHQYHPSIFKF